MAAKKQLVLVETVTDWDVIKTMLEVRKTDVRTTHRAFATTVAATTVVALSLPHPLITIAVAGLTATVPDMDKHLLKFLNIVGSHIPFGRLFYWHF